MDIGGGMEVDGDGVRGCMGREEAEEPVEDGEEVRDWEGKRGGAGGSSYARPL